MFRDATHTMLYLVDDEGNPVHREIRSAVEAAFRNCIRQFSRVDETILAGFAESVAASMNRRRGEIQAPKQYARVAMHGRVQEWFRAHPAKELAVDRIEELEQVPGGMINRSLADAELDILFSQIKTHLSERERHILVLLEQDLGPCEIGVALGISYNAAAKAMQRVKEHMASIVASPSGKNGEEADSSRHSSSTNLG